MSKEDGVIRSQKLTYRLGDIQSQCRLAVNLLIQDPCANINLNLLYISTVLDDCRGIILVYDKE